MKPFPLSHENVIKTLDLGLPKVERLPCKLLTLISIFACAESGQKPAPPLILFASYNFNGGKGLQNKKNAHPAWESAWETMNLFVWPNRDTVGLVGGARNDLSGPEPQKIEWSG